MSVAPIWCLPRPFSQNTNFLKKALKTNKFWKIQNFFCISGGNFIGLFNGILFVFILSVVVDIQKEASEFYCRTISGGGQLRWTGKNVCFCVPPIIDIMKTNKGWLKSPIKMLQEMQKNFNFSKIVGF